METKKNPKELNRFIEKIRLMHSSDSAYQHLLDTIADDVYHKFKDIFGYEPNVWHNFENVVGYIREWKP